MSAPKIVTLDIERQSAIVGSIWQLNQKYSTYIRPSQIIVPVRTICFAWKWMDEDEVHFSAEWDPYDTGHAYNTYDKPLPYKDTGLREVYPGHQKMIEIARNVMDKADYVIGWNSKRYDMGNLRSHMAEYDLVPPSPHKDVDLITTSRGQFGFMSHTLEEVAPHFGLDGKYPHEAGLWEGLRWLPYNDPYGQDVWDKRATMRTYNQRDVELTEQIFYKMRPWIPKLNLFGGPDTEGLFCTACGSANVQMQGTRRFTNYWYHRFLCMNCGHWGHTSKSFYHMEQQSS
jgi:hypothetical protein